jgi:hypothetical protein
MKQMSEVTKFRNQCEELLKLVDTLKQNNTQKLYGMFVNTKEPELLKQQKK